MARRHVFAAILLASVVAVSGTALRSSTHASSSVRIRLLTSSNEPAPLAAPVPVGTEAVVAARDDRLTKLVPPDRRLSTRDSRPLDLAALVAGLALGLAGLGLAHARRRPGRAPTSLRSVAPARAPPLLLPS